MFMKAPFSGMKKDVKEDNRARYVTNVAQYLPQIPLVFEDLDVIDNVLAPYRDRDREKALRLAEAMGLGQVANSLASSLSSGEKARLSFARALYGDHPVVLLDEVTASLDPVSAGVLREQVLALSKERLVIFAPTRKTTFFQARPSSRSRMGFPMRERRIPRPIGPGSATTLS